ETPDPAAPTGSPPAPQDKYPGPAIKRALDGARAQLDSAESLLAILQLALDIKFATSTAAHRERVRTANVEAPAVSARSAFARVKIPKNFDGPPLDFATSVAFPEQVAGPVGKLAKNLREEIGRLAKRSDCDATM